MTAATTPAGVDLLDVASYHPSFSLNPGLCCLATSASPEPTTASVAAKMYFTAAGGQQLQVHGAVDVASKNMPVAAHVALGELTGPAEML
ncbi:Fc.00g069100.m01.CDS01 [Cosmosporella sp. VM-42]